MRLAWALHACLDDDLDFLTDGWKQGFPKFPRMVTLVDDATENGVQHFRLLGAAKDIEEAYGDRRARRPSDVMWVLASRPALSS